MEQQKGARLLSSCLNMRKQLNKLLSNGSLTQGEYLVLRNIRLSGAALPLKAAELSEMLDLSRPSITRILNMLEHRGFIMRHIDTSDRRSISIELTEKGAEALDHANGALLRISETLVTALGEIDTDKLIDLVDKLSEIYKAMLDESEGESDAR